MHPPRSILPSPLFATLFASAAALAAACAPGSSPATEITVGPETVAFRGTTTETIDIDADGSWVADTSQPWLTLERVEGPGGEVERVALSVDRSALDVGLYEAQITLYGDSETTVSVPVTMRFPELSGSVSSADGHLQARRTDLRAHREPEPGVDYVPGEIIVGLDRPMVALSQHGQLDAEVTDASLQASSERLAASVGAVGAELQSSFLSTAIVTVDSDDVRDTVDALVRDGRVRYAAPNYVYHTQATNDEHYGAQWHYQNINLEEAWDITTGYEEVLVAVIDADFHPSHPDLEDNLLPGWNFQENSDDIEIMNGDCYRAHGTHVAGTVGAVTGNEIGVAGVAQKLQILPLNVGSRSGPPCGLTGIASAILYAAGLESPPGAPPLDRPVDVINMSLGGERVNLATRDAVREAHEAGVIVVVAAGNEPTDPLTQPETAPCDVMFPAAHPEAIAVAATDINDDRAPYSCTGPELTIAAPGGNCTDQQCSEGVLSTDWNYSENQPSVGFKNGTSMASPHVAGIAALMRAVNPNISPDEVAQILIDSTPPGDHDIFLGHGLTDAAAAVAAAQDTMRVSANEVLVRLYQGQELIAESNGGAGGSFDFGSLAAGEYRLVAGNLRNGELGAPGTVYGEADVIVNYDGDVDIQVPVQAQ